MNPKKLIRRILIYTIIAIFIICALFPIYWMLITSLKSTTEIYNREPTFWPRRIVLDGYENLFSERGYLNNIKNSLLVSITVTAVSVFASMLAAYAIAKLRFRGRKQMSLSILYAYLLPTSVLFIPVYILITRANLKDTLLGLIVVYPTFTIPYATWMLISYFRSIPVDVEEAAIIDGCNRMKVMFSISFPLSMPGIVSTAIFSFNLCWGEYLYALVIISKKTARTVTLALADMIVGDTYSWGPMMAGAIIATIPVLVLYYLASGQIVSGMTAGSVKG